MVFTFSKTVLIVSFQALELYEWISGRVNCRSRAYELKFSIVSFRNSKALILIYKWTKKSISPTLSWSLSKQITECLNFSRLILMFQRSALSNFQLVDSTYSFLQPSNLTIHYTFCHEWDFVILMRLRNREAPTTPTFTFRSAKPDL